MKQNIRHPRLHAFYSSKVLNSLMMVIVVSLLMMLYTGSLLLPGICCALALAFFIGYALWFWIKKPKTVVVNEWLSSLTGWFILYFLIVGAMKSPNPWWYIFPVALAVPALFITLVNNKDERVEL